VQIPGQTLAPGTYVFKLLDSPSNRHIVQVFDQNEKHLYATILAIPSERMNVTGHTVVRFDERASNEPQAVKEWFYPGDSIGQEFVYKKGEAMQVAQTTTSTQTEVAVNNEPPAVTEPAPTETTPAPSVEEPSTPATPSPSAEETPDAGLPQDQAKPDTSTEQKPAEETNKLPKTGSEIPMIAVLGLGALGSAGMLRLRRRRSS
jgi:LPXTG-motif cell wall-anchored protein